MLIGFSDKILESVFSILVKKYLGFAVRYGVKRKIFSVIERLVKIKWVKKVVEIGIVKRVVERFLNFFIILLVEV